MNFLLLFMKEKLLTLFEPWNPIQKFFPFCFLNIDDLIFFSSPEILIFNHFLNMILIEGWWAIQVWKKFSSKLNKFSRLNMKKIFPSTINYFLNFFFWKVGVKDNHSRIHRKKKRDPLVVRKGHSSKFHVGTRDNFKRKISILIQGFFWQKKF